MNNIEQVYFDFNGTLYFDDEINKIGWKKTIAELSNNQINIEEFCKDSGRYKNSAFIQLAYKQLHKECTQKDIEYWSLRKESIYQEHSIKNNLTVFPPGAERLLDYLKNKNIPMVLCTLSIAFNIDFYFKYFNLYRWFKKEETIYDTGEYSNKKEMYEYAIRRTKLDPKKILVFEDSPNSINLAVEAGVKNIIAIKKPGTPNHKEIKQIINDYTELDYSIFEQNTL